jgi:ArsR family transcriptional regulator, arsenate/arsenite/antimonite-responsive transcriptional repressor / arsenate reductase (thioredoxin)
VDPEVVRRAAVHHALGDVHRLVVVDALWVSDRTPTELRELTGLPSNLLAFHLDVLEAAGLIARHRSQGDGRRRYVTLRTERLHGYVGPAVPRGPGEVLFVCTHNAARSQMAAALWTATTGEPSLSAGTDPAPAVHPVAVRVARSHGLDLSDAAPRSYEQVDAEPGLVVSVCDRARESPLPFEAPMVHWSVGDPMGGRRTDFDRAFSIIQERVGRLAEASVRGDRR